MPKFVVEGNMRGLFYVGPSLTAALAALQREHHQCAIVHRGLSDAKLHCDGVLVKTALGADGVIGIAKARPRPVLPPIEVPKKHWQR